MSFIPKAEYDFSTWSFEDFRRLRRCVLDYSKKSQYSKLFWIEDSLATLARFDEPQGNNSCCGNLKVVNKGKVAGIAASSTGVGYRQAKMHIVKKRSGQEGLS